MEAQGAPEGRVFCVVTVVAAGRLPPSVYASAPLDASEEAVGALSPDFLFKRARALQI